MRVARDAVPAHAGTGIERHEAVGLGRGRLDHLDRRRCPVRAASANSLASAMLTARKVFSSSLVISAASGLDTSCRLLAVCAHDGGLGGACRRNTADHPGGVIVRVRLDTGVDPLGGERHEDVLTDSKPLLAAASPADRGCSRRRSSRSARWSGRPQRCSTTSRRPRERPQVGGLVGVDRGGHADQIASASASACGSVVATTSRQ